MRTHDLGAGRPPAHLVLDDLVDEYGRLRLMLALLWRRREVSEVPVDDRLRADMGLPPVDQRPARLGPPFTLWL